MSINDPINQQMQLLNKLHLNKLKYAKNNNKCLCSVYLKFSDLSVYFCSFNMFTQGPLKLKIVLGLQACWFTPSQKLI